MESAVKNASFVIEKTLGLIRELGAVLGIFTKESANNVDSEIEELILKREEARKVKDFKTADEIRDKLKAMNIVLKDTPMGVKWTRI